MGILQGTRDSWHTSIRKLDAQHTHGKRVGSICYEDGYTEPVYLYGTDEHGRVWYEHNTCIYAGINTLRKVAAWEECGNGKLRFER